VCTDTRHTCQRRTGSHPASVGRRFAHQFNDIAMLRRPSSRTRPPGQVAVGRLASHFASAENQPVLTMIAG
jgi:hypothetical protein